MHELKLRPPNHHHVLNGEVLRSGDLAFAGFSSTRARWLPLDRRLIGDIYDSDWHEHPSYVVRHDDVIAPPDPGLLADYHRRYADYLEEGVPVDPRDQALLDASALIDFKFSVFHRRQRGPIHRRGPE